MSQVAPNPSAQAPLKTHQAKPQIENKSFWMAHFKQHSEAGPSTLSAYCRVHHLNYHRALYWQRKLRTQHNSTVIPVILQRPTKPNVFCTVRFGSDAIVEITSPNAWESLLERIAR